jgi:hypothetical protein
MTQRPPAAGTPIVVVLGMHRTGSSVITRGLQALGLDLGDHLMPPAVGDNARGFFEDLDIYSFNERVLQKAQSAWDKVSPLRPEDLTGPAYASERQEARALLAAKIGNRTFAFKDPRTALLLPLWQCVFSDLGLDDRYVVTVRNPMESALSLKKRDGFPIAKGILLWITHVAEALRHTSGKVRVLVSYDAVLAAPAVEMQRIATALQLPDPASAGLDAYAGDFISIGLRRNQVSAGELARSGQTPQFAIDLYAALLSAAKSADSKIDDETLMAFLSIYDQIKPLFPYIDALNASALHRSQDLEQATAAQAELSDALSIARTQAEAAKAAQQRELEEQRAVAAEQRARADAEIENLLKRDAERQIQNDTLKQQLKELEALSVLNAQRSAEQLETMKRALAILHDDLTSSNATRAAVAAQLQQAEVAATAQRAESERLTETMNALATEQRASQRDLLLARAALTETRSSTSWRLTAPLRALSSAARSMLNAVRKGLGR